MKKYTLMIALVLCLFLFSTAQFAPVVAEDPPPAPAQEITYIAIGQEFNREGQIESTAVTVTGTNIETVMVIPMGTGMPTVLKDQLPEYPHVFYGTLNQDQIGDMVYINGIPYNIAIGSMPQISEVMTRRVERHTGTLEIKGANFLEVNAPNIKAQYGRGTTYSDFPADFFDNDNHLSGDGLSAAPGLKNILFTKSTSSNGVPVEIKYEFRQQFSLIEMPIFDGLEMFPNRGEKGDQVFFEAPSLPDSSVFLLRAIDGTDPFSKANKAKTVSYRDGLLIVEVPDFADEEEVLGEYYVVLTNPVATGKDPVEEVWRETVVGKIVDGEFEAEKFTVIDGSTKGRILSIQPNEGPDTGSPAEITGLRMGSLNVDDLVVSGQPSGIITDNGRLLRVNYGTGSYSGKEVAVVKEIRVLIANSATFRAGSTFSTSLDRLLITTPEITDATVSPRKDVVIETETILTEMGGKTYVFKERMVLPEGYTYIPARITPVLTEIVPDKVPIKSNNTTELDLWVAFKGESFFVHRYDNRLWYPAVSIADVGEFNPNVDPGVEMMVFDSSGNILDGIAGREFGTKMLLKIPADMAVPEGPRDVVIRNPIRNNPQEYINSDTFISGIRFIRPPVLRIPNIDSVLPNVVSTDGGEIVRISGGQFQPNIQVLIDGEIVSNIERDGTGTRITFTAPPGRQGKTQLQVVNPGIDGGVAVWDFYYVETYTQPEIIDFLPKFGTEDTLVIIEGNNFLRPDPSAYDIQLNDFEINKLIGATVYLGGLDVNEYHRDINKKIILQDYVSNLGEELFTLDEQGELRLAPYFYSIILERPAGIEDALNYHMIEKDSRGRVIISDGFSNRYVITANPDTSFEAAPFLAEKIEGSNQGVYTLEIEVSAERQQVLIKNGEDVILELFVKTPYKINADTNQIIGNRVKVIDSKTIYFRVPKMSNGYHELRVVNPDTKAVIAAESFRYREDPQNVPRIDLITPNFGSHEGGYYITIVGENFQDTGEYKSRVFLGGVEIAFADTDVSMTGDEIVITVPAYDFDKFLEKNTSIIRVPVVVVNSNGGSDALEEGFAYVIPSSEPRISRLIPYEGPAAGGSIVEIFGKEFLFSKNAAGELVEAPKVYFGKNKAEVIECTGGYMRVLTPPAAMGTVPVFVLNLDGGVSNKDKTYNYIESKPTIKNITPPLGRTQGGEWVDISGSQFAPDTITMLEKHGDTTVVVNKPADGFTSRVRFGNLTNEHIPIGQPNSGWISGGNPVVRLPGDLRVEYNLTEKQVALEIIKDGVIYRELFTYYGEERFISVQQLQNQASEAYIGRELIRLRIVDRRLIVERGYSPEVVFESTGHLRAMVPSYHTVGTLVVKVINPDGGEATGQFEYRTPDSNPYISNITKDGRNPEQGQLPNGEPIRVIRLDYKGGNRVSIIGGDFRQNADIRIGDILTIASGDISTDLPTRLTFTVPEVSEDVVGRFYRVMVANEDGGLAFSDEVQPRPIYIVFIKATSSPAVEAIMPNAGPSKGGTEVIIKGKDFRADPQGKPPLVFFGEQQAVNVIMVDYMTLRVITPAHESGWVEVRVENHDGALSRPTGIFTYISSPTINTVVDPQDPTETKVIDSISVEGGQSIKLKGAGFEANMKVIFNPVVRELVSGENKVGKEIIYIDGLAYVLVSGRKADNNDIVFVDAQTVVVKAPAGSLGDSGIIAVNKDSGASSIYKNLHYGLPVLASPEGVRAELVFDRYIRMHWQSVDNAKGYDIYVVIDGKGAEYVGTTEITSFMYSDLSPRTNYRFVVRAVGNFGSSQQSVKSNLVTTGNRVGYPDTDGAINESTTIINNGGIVQVNLGTGDYDNKELVIDLLRGNLVGSREVVIAMPAGVVASNSTKNIQVIGRDFVLNFNPGMFNNSQIYNYRDRDDVGVSLKIKPFTDNLKLPGANDLSGAYIVEASMFIGAEYMEYDYLRGFMHFTLDYDSSKAELRRLNDISLNRFDEYLQKWEPVPLQIVIDGGNSITAITDRVGKYLIIGSRR